MADVTTEHEQELSESSLYVLSLSDFFKAYAQYQERTFVPAPSGMQKIKQQLHMLWIDVTTLLRLRGKDAPYYFFVGENEEPDPMKSFLREMKTGTILSIGFILPRSVEALPVVIPKEVWRNPEPDFMRGTVSGAGFSFAHVRIVMKTTGFPEAKDAEPFISEPLPEIAAFSPSDDSRLGWDIPAIAAAREPAMSDTTANSPTKESGRPSCKIAIIAAFDTIEKNLNWTNKQLAAAIRTQVKASTGKLDDKGLGDDAILKHIRDPWQSFKEQKS